jgi:hypothetical protein
MQGASEVDSCSAQRLATTYLSAEFLCSRSQLNIKFLVKDKQLADGVDVTAQGS